MKVEKVNISFVSVIIILVITALPANSFQGIGIGLTGLHNPENSEERTGELSLNLPLFWWVSSQFAGGGDEVQEEKKEDDRVRELIKKGVRGGLTDKEYKELIKKCPEEDGGWILDLEDGSPTEGKYIAKDKDDDQRRWEAKGAREAEAERKKRDREKVQAKLKEDEDYKAAHGGHAHSPCECWKLEAWAEYEEGSGRKDVAITSKDPKKPTKIPAKNLKALKGRAKERPGKYFFKDLGVSCCENDYVAHYVQIAISVPRGKGRKPRYDGPNCPRGITEPERPEDLFPPPWDAGREYELWLTLSSTPGSYKWDMAQATGKYRIGPKKEAWVYQIMGRKKGRKILAGLGKIELIVDGKVCETVYYEFVFEEKAALLDKAPVYSVVGAIEVIAEHKGQPIPEATITIFQGDKVITEVEADKCGVALIPLEEGTYTVVIESYGKVAKDTITIEQGKLVSCTGDLARDSIDINSTPIDRYRPLNKARIKKGYRISSADLDGLISYRIETPQGSIYLGFPYYAIPGETISFRAILLPNGTSRKEIAKNLEKMKQYEFLIDDERFSLEEPTLWRLKARDTAKLALESRKRGQLLAEIMADFVLHNEPPTESANLGTDAVYYSTAGWPVCIPGKFDGIAENTQVHLGDSEMEIIAETPSCVIFNPPRRLTGLRDVRILEGESTFECFVRNVYLELTADKHELRKGETTRLHLKILGLEGLEKTAYVSLFNQTTEVVAMSAGNSQFFVIQPGDEGSGGVALYDRTLTGIKRGTFVITAILSYSLRQE